MAVFFNGAFCLPLPSAIEQEKNVEFAKVSTKLQITRGLTLLVLNAQHVH